MQETAPITQVIRNKNDEGDTFSDHIVLLFAKSLGARWLRVPEVHDLEDDQLAQLLRGIVEYAPTTAGIGADWVALVKEENKLLLAARDAEPSIDSYLKECWKSGLFSVIRYAGSPRAPFHGSIGITHIQDSSFLTKSCKGQDAGESV